MAITNRNEALLLFIGDIFFFFLSLWLMLFVRFHSIPDPEIFWDHAVPFSIIFVFWFMIFFISGLYEKHTLILKSKIPSIILNAQIINSVIAVIFFYFVPVFGISPKTNLFVYVIISFGLILFWRIKGVEAFTARIHENAILVGRGEEMIELREEVNNNPRYGLRFVASYDLADPLIQNVREEIVATIRSGKVQIIVADFKNEKLGPILPNLYDFIFSNVRYIDIDKLYEDIFDRIPTSLLGYDWFLENISISSNKIYDVVKRVVDIAIGLVIGVVSLVFYPFIVVAILFEDGKPIFFSQNRIGQNNKIFKVSKFRSMRNHQELSGIAKNPQVTGVGNILRKTRLDELPQIWSVIRGDLSLVGPRPEIPDLAHIYEKEIPYYNVRHLIKPGLSGWAQLYQKTPPKWSAGLTETKLKLSYDLYYLKNRSFMLDLKIGLKTIKTLISLAGI